MTVLDDDELAAVARYLREGHVDLAGDLTATPISGGRSNLTYQLTDGHARWVLRMPPRVGRTPSAHDVEREFRVTQALSTTDVPVARPIAFCKDESLVGRRSSSRSSCRGRPSNRRRTSTRWMTTHSAWPCPGSLRR